ncbi:MAG: hypothetical protein JKY37_31860 [Nannocystaceae bacterium]|nr:hypothetical protein [Nannocystaceae bacterium]
MPATPVWTAGSPTVFVVPAGGGGTLRGSWSAVEAADSYRVEIGQDKRGGFVSTAVVVPGDITQLEAHNLAPGKYFAIVSAIDDDAFESIPSRMLHAELRETALVGTGGAPIAIPAATEEPTVPKPIPLLVGTALTAPAGLQCAFGNGELSTAPIAMAVGEQVVACQDEAGRAVPGFSVVVQALKVAPSVGGTKGITLALGEAAALTLQLSSPAGVPKTLRIDAPSGVTVSDLDLDDQGKLTASVTASAKAPRTGELRLVSGTGEDKVTLGVASFTVAVAGEGPAAELANGEKSDPWIKRHAPTRNLVEIGVFGGVFFPHPQLELFEFTLDREDFGYQKQQSVALITGPRVSFAPLRFLAFEFDGAVIPSSAGGDRTTMWVARGQLLGQVGLWNTTPYVLAGFGAFGVASDRDAVGNDVDGAFHYGGGLKFFVSRRVMLRFEARDTLSSQRGIADGVAHSIELTAGLGFTLNRR